MLGRDIILNKKNQTLPFGFFNFKKLWAN